MKAVLEIILTRYAGAGAKSKGGYPPRIEERMRAKTIVFAVATRTPQTGVSAKTLVAQWDQNNFEVAFNSLSNLNNPWDIQ